MSLQAHQWPRLAPTPISTFKDSANWQEARFVRNTLSQALKVSTWDNVFSGAPTHIRNVLHPRL